MKNIKIILLLLLCVCLSGCFEKLASETEKMIPARKAFYTSEPLNIDGKLDEPVWQRATSYQFSLSKDKTDNGKTLKEAGNVRFAWDDKYFYVAADFQDSDITAKGQKDQMHHYRLGDLCELFLKPLNRPYYWELYVTPASKKTSFFFLSKDSLKSPESFESYTCDLKVAAQNNGTLNDSNDMDTNWTGEMAMPIKDIEAQGYKFGPGYKWTVFIGRYNYSVYFDGEELSMSPQLSLTSYHLTDEYAVLEFVR